jgi:hypothetical protein
MEVMNKRVHARTHRNVEGTGCFISSACWNNYFSPCAGRQFNGTVSVVHNYHCKTLCSSLYVSVCFLLAVKHNFVSTSPHEQSGSLYLALLVSTLVLQHPQVALRVRLSLFCCPTCVHTAVDRIPKCVNIWCSFVHFRGSRPPLQLRYVVTHLHTLLLTTACSSAFPFLCRVFFFLNLTYIARFFLCKLPPHVAAQ